MVFVPERKRVLAGFVSETSLAMQKSRMGQLETWVCASISGHLRLHLCTWRLGIRGLMDTPVLGVYHSGRVVVQKVGLSTVPLRRTWWGSVPEDFHDFIKGLESRMTFIDFGADESYLVRYN